MSGVRLLIKERIYILLLILLTFVVWNKVLGQTFLGEAYYYFSRSQNFIDSAGNLTNVWQYDNLAKIMFDILPPLFADTLFYYLFFQLAVHAALNIFVYLAILKITNNRLIALASAVFFLTNYMGSFEMMAIGNYQRFAQRVPNLIPLFASLYFLHDYLQSKRVVLYVYSLVLFSVGVFLAHFSTFLMPIFVIYPLVFFYSKRKNTRLWRYLLTALSYVAINLFLISKDPHNPRVSFVDFIASDAQIIKKVFIQFSNVSLPPIITEVVMEYSKFSYVATMSLMGFFSLLLFMSMLRFVKSSLRVFYISSIFAVLAILFLNLYSYRKVIDPLIQTGQARFYFVPSILMSVVWAISLFGILTRITRYYVFVTIIILVGYVGYNYFLISRDIDANQYKSIAMERYVSYVKSVSHEFNNDSIIVAPSYVSWPNQLIADKYGSWEMTFVLPNDGWEEKVSDNRENVFVFDYDYNPTHENKYGKVVDLTDRFRAGEDVKFYFDK